MKPPILHHQHARAVYTVPMKAGAQITAQAYIEWTSQQESAKTFKVFLRAKGELQDKGARWSDEWLFQWPEGDLKRLEDSLRLIAQYVDQRQNYGVKRNDGVVDWEYERREVFVDVYDWLRVGWIDVSGAWKGYVRFTKGGQTMEAEFEDIRSLSRIRGALYQAMQQH